MDEARAQRRIQKKARQEARREKRERALRATLEPDPLGFIKRRVQDLSRHKIGAVLVGAVLIFLAVSSWVSNFYGAKGGLFPPPPPLSETELTPNARARLEERMAAFGALEEYQIDSVSDFDPPLQFLDSLMEKGPRFNLSPGALSLRVTGPRPGQRVLKDRVSPMDASEYLIGLRTTGMFPVHVELFPEGALKVGPEGMRFEYSVGDGGTSTMMVRPGPPLR